MSSAPRGWLVPFAIALGLASLGGCGGTTLAPGQCITSRECNTNEQCVSGACVALTKKGCRTDDQCAEGQYCDVGSCRSRAAIPDAGPSSPTDTGVVAPSEDAGKPETCAVDGDCKTAQVCESSACVPACTELGSPLVCGGDTQCSAVSGRCEPIAPTACTRDNQCPAPAQVCEAGRCAPGCSAPGGATCGGGTICDTATGRCAPDPSCTRDGDCGAPSSICEAGRCVPGCGRPGAAACDAVSVCDQGTGRCVPVPGTCANDSACGAPRSVCESGQCVPGCGEAGGIQCSGATVCSATSGRCDPTAPPPCATDAACAPPSTICVAGQCVAGCTASSCGASQVCGAQSGRCEAAPNNACVADAFEANDTVAAASTAVNTSGTEIPGLTACAADDDYYAITLAAGDRVRVDVLFANAEGDIDARLQTPSGATGASSVSTDDDESLDYTANTAGTFVLRVWLYADQGTTPGNTYRLRVTVTAAPPPPMCASDRLEENDSASAARPLTPGTETGLTVCANDDDYYAIALLPGDELTATATFQNADGDIDLDLLSSAGASLDSSAGVSGTETVTYTSFTAQTVTLATLLYRDQGTNPGNTYQLAVSTTAVCAEDRYEQNDSQSAQRALAAGTYTGLSQCGVDDDFYRVTLTRNQVLTVNVRFAHAEGDIDLYVLDTAGTILTSSESLDDDEALTFTAPSAGNYTVVTTLYQDLGTRPGNYYTLELVY